MLAPVVGEAHRQLLHAAAAGAVGAEAGVTGDAGDRADVDDAAVAARDHVPGDGLGDEEVPRRLVSRIVFQSSQVTSTAGLRMLQPALLTRMSMWPSSPSASATALSMLACSRTSSSTQATRRPSASHFVGERFERGARAAGDGEIGAGAGQGAGELLAEAAAGAGDEGGFAGEVEGVGHE